MTSKIFAYHFLPSKTSGGRYHSVTTSLEYVFVGNDFALANPKSANFNSPFELINRFWGCHSFKQYFIFSRINKYDRWDFCRMEIIGTWWEHGQNRTNTVRFGQFEPWVSKTVHFCQFGPSPKTTILWMDEDSNWPNTTDMAFLGQNWQNTVHFDRSR